MNEVMAHGDTSLSNIASVLEMVLGLSVDTSVFAFGGSSLCNATDSPAPGAEIQYLVLMDYGDRRTVTATQYQDTDTANIWQRQIYQGAWRQSKWALIATATPPQEFDLPLVAGIEKWNTVKCCYCKDQFGKVLVHFAVQKQDGSTFSRDDILATLPVGYRPSAYVYNAGTCHTVSPVLSHTISVDSSGAIRIYPNLTANPDTINGTIEFIAAP